MCYNSGMAHRGWLVVPLVREVIGSKVTCSIFHDTYITGCQTLERKELTIMTSLFALKIEAWQGFGRPKWCYYARFCHLYPMAKIAWNWVSWQKPSTRSFARSFKSQWWRGSWRDLSLLKQCCSSQWFHTTVWWVSPLKEPFSCEQILDFVQGEQGLFNQILPPTKQGDKG